MNKNITKILIVFMISVFLLPAFSQAQIKTYTYKKFKPPAVSVELLFNYSQPIAHLFSDITRFFSFDGYGVKTGFGSEINVKLSADKKGRITPYATLGYNLFLGSGDNAYIDSNIMNIYPLKGSSIYGPVSGTSKMFIHDFNFGLGFSYTFVNKTRWTPFLGADLDMHLLFGTYRQTPNTVVGPGTTAEVSYTMKQAVRFGFGIGGGVSLRVSQPVGFVFETKYKFANLLAKDSQVSTEVNKFYLNDQKNTDLNTNLVKDRQIDYLQFSLGIAFYIGKK
jgi:hypothetical protein